MKTLVTFCILAWASVVEAVTPNSCNGFFCGSSLDCNPGELCCSGRCSLNATVGLAGACDPTLVNPCLICSPPLACSPGTSKCEYPKALDSCGCTTGSDCLSGLCSSTTKHCLLTGLFEGTPCEFSSQCRKGNCTGGFCISHKKQVVDTGTAQLADPCAITLDTSYGLSIEMSNCSYGFFCDNNTYTCQTAWPTGTHCHNDTDPTLSDDQKCIGGRCYEGKCSTIYNYKEGGAPCTAYYECESSDCASSGVCQATYAEGPYADCSTTGYGASCDKGLFCSFGDYGTAKCIAGSKYSKKSGDACVHDDECPADSQCIHYVCSPSSSGNICNVTDTDNIYTECPGQNQYIDWGFSSPMECVCTNNQYRCQIQAGYVGAPVITPFSQGACATVQYPTDLYDTDKGYGPQHVITNVATFGTAYEKANLTEYLCCLLCPNLQAVPQRKFSLSYPVTVGIDCSNNTFIQLPASSKTQACALTGPSLDVSQFVFNCPAVVFEPHPVPLSNPPPTPAPPEQYDSVALGVGIAFGVALPLIILVSYLCCRASRFVPIAGDGETVEDVNHQLLAWSAASDKSRQSRTSSSSAQSSEESED